MNWTRLPWAGLLVLRLSLVPLPAQESLIPSGRFLMGDASPGMEGLADERPAHPAQVAPFYMERFEVSAALWRQVRQWGLWHGYADLPEGICGSLTNGDSGQPVTGVSWYDVVKWCNARSESQGLAPAYYTDATQAQPLRNGQPDLSNPCVQWDAAGYRLPTEAEWEYAARGTLSGQDYPWAGRGGSYRDHLDGARANYRNSGDPLDNGTTPPGYYNGAQQPPGRPGNNLFWLYDLGGNVAEWCWDAYAPDDYTARLAGGLAVNPQGPEIASTGGCRGARGGSWDSAPFDLRCSFRDPAAPAQRDTRTGLRCVRSCGVSNQALVCTFEVAVENGQTQVRWATAAEPGTVGFYLKRLAGGRPVPVGAALIPATGAAQGGIGAAYASADCGAPSSAVYQLVEVRPDGGTILHGPFERPAYRFELTPAVPMLSGGLQVRWRSRSNEWYSVWRSTNLAAGFIPLQTWIIPTPPENAFYDATVGGANVFYRVRSEP